MPVAFPKNPPEHESATVTYVQVTVVSIVPSERPGWLKVALSFDASDVVHAELTAPHGSPYKVGDKVPIRISLS